MKKYLVIHRHEAFNGLDFWTGPNTHADVIEADSAEGAAAKIRATHGEILVLPMAAGERFIVQRKVVAA